MGFTLVRRPASTARPPRTHRLVFDGLLAQPAQVVLEDDPTDWVCAFAKTRDFPARRWAQDMARTYNARLGACQRTGGASGAAEPWMPGAAGG